MFIADGDSDAVYYQVYSTVGSASH